MINLLQFPIQELPAGRNFFKKAEFFTHFYYLEEGRATVSISQISIEVSTPMFVGDYQIIADIQYRVTMIKSLSRCKIRLIPKQLYHKFNHNHEDLTQSFRKFNIKHKVLRYWLKKLFLVSYHNKNDVVKCQNSIGIVLEGEFKHASNIPIVKMKQRNFQLLRKFDISIIGEHEIFQEGVVCQSHRGKAGILIQKYVSQLTTNFQEFSGILGVSTFKKKMHINMTKQIAKNCMKKRNLFQNMIPITLKHSIQHEQQNSNRSSTVQNKLIQDKKGRYSPRKLTQSDEVFTVKDNITQFLHNQWRRGLSLSLPRKQNQALKLKEINSFRKKKIQNFKNPQMIQLSIPQHFKELKFNFKMLLKSKDNSFTKSKRLKTQPAQPARPKLLFQD